MFVQWPLAKTYPTGRHGMVAAKHPLAAEAGVDILRRGGTAIDAAIATSFAAGVVEPYMSGIGGGGLALYHPKGGKPRALHFGTRAPASAAPDMYQIVPGAFDTDLFGWPLTRGDANVSGPQSIALPNLVPGLHRLWQLGGRLPWRDLVEPAIGLAAQGFPVDWLTSLRTLERYELLSRFATTRAVFLPNGRPPKPDLGLGGETLQQPDLARTLRAISDDPDALSRGEIAQSTVDASDGRLTLADLSAGKLPEGDALSIPFSGVDVHLVPWATGGPTILEWLGILQALDSPQDDQHADFWWALLSAGYIALRDRLARLADPEFEPFPAEILQPEYHQRVADAIRAGRLGPVTVPPGAGSTTHIAVVDADENVVSLTQTLLSLWGSGVVTPRTGICLNNGMMWFDPEPGRSNSIAPGKLPLANMCPILVTKRGEPFLAFGASGGRRILPALVQILARVALLGYPLAEAMAAPRIEITKDEVMADVRFGPAFCDRLARRLGRPVVMRDPVLGASPWASPVGLIRLDDGSWTGAADPYTMACVLEA